MAESLGVGPRMTAPSPLEQMDAGLRRQLADGAAALRPWLVDLRRHFHRHPELGWREVETTRRIVAELTDLGYETISGRDLLGDTARLGMSSAAIPGEGDTGCLAIFDTGRPGPTVCLRVDIDALPIREANENHKPAAEGWASEAEGVMHACGHDGHIALGLGTARLVRPLLESGRGKLKLLFQPAEEGGRGARAVVDAGWMEDVDLFLAVHLGLGVPSGTVALDVNEFLATRKYAVALEGRPAHAGKEPEAGRNALLAACQMVPALHALAQSSIAGVRVNVGRLEAGTALNIVPQFARFEFEIRAGTNEALEDLDLRCRRLVEATAQAHEVRSVMELRGSAEAWRNPGEMVTWAEGINRATSVYEHTLQDHPFGASEDATVLANAVTADGGRAAIFVLGADLADGHHTPHFDFDEDALAPGVHLLGALIASALAITSGEARK
ncbi:amidohydrolase [Actibacterium sp. MT2.3-13A]|uniref:amidohydrolase n=1 Tax=Actibacterium sp. MT2.3-13A TaxID=2828332 RepID=UPI001BAA1024|nr:amidohydrolase [Actibacterium sp. MT2.3-13A]